MIAGSRIYLTSEFGHWLIEGSADGLCLLQPCESVSDVTRGCSLSWDLVNQAGQELGEYFSGKRQVFTVKVATAEQSDFARDIWQALRLVSCGSTVSYGELAKLAGRPKSQRAVGQVLHRNPLAIIQPCHRVTQANGGIGGFAFGTDLKARLLRHEVRVTGTPWSGDYSLMAE